MSQVNRCSWVLGGGMVLQRFYLALYQSRYWGSALILSFPMGDYSEKTMP